MYILWLPLRFKIMYFMVRKLVNIIIGPKKGELYSCE